MKQKIMPLYWWGRLVTNIYIMIMYNVVYTGMENIPQKGGFILVSNHRSNFDPLILAHKCRFQLHFMAKAELFKNKFLAWAFRNVGAYPVQRGKGDSSAIEWAAEIIGSERVLGMFPEGTRSKDGVILRPKSGTALIAQKTHADILPCYINYTGAMKFRTKINVHYGEIISFEQLGFSLDNTEISARTLKHASTFIMEKIVENKK